ncbi:MAG: hypothetical protein LAN59_08905 [Acidobacteriia bacterium]|nr:hypothetical protein [Terriglobia bacterium]
MKHIVFIFALLVVIAPAKAQTTNTNCTVIGNQISCQSTTQTAPPFAPLYVPPPTPQTPLVTPQVAMLIAERNRAAAEAMRRDVDRFTAELSSHDAWVSVKSGNSYHVRMSDDHIYIFRIVPPGANWSGSMECAPGTSPGIWDCLDYLNVSRFSEQQMFRKNKTCSLKTHAILSTVSLERIVGESEDFGPKDIDWGKCKVKKVERNAFTFIPRTAQPQQ